jgi:hypothetical protein
VIVYIETNFILAAATGQDPDADTLIATEPARLRIGMPSVCVMEAWHALLAKRKEFNSFIAHLASRIREAQRDLTAPLAASLLQDLISAEDKSSQLLNEVQRRFKHRRYSYK